MNVVSCCKWKRSFNAQFNVTRHTAVACVMYVTLCRCCTCCNALLYNASYVRSLATHVHSVISVIRLAYRRHHPGVISNRVYNPPFDLMFTLIRMPYMHSWHVQAAFRRCTTKIQTSLSYDLSWFKLYMYNFSMYVNMAVFLYTVVLTSQHHHNMIYGPPAIDPRIFFRGNTSLVDWQLGRGYLACFVPLSPLLSVLTGQYCVLLW